MACCTITHDNYINEYLSSILTTSCMRKYPEFEYLMCFGCHPFESLYIDKVEKKIRVCKEFALKMWGKDNNISLNNPTTVFDNCGFKGTSFLHDEAILNHRVVIPSQV